MDIDMQMDISSPADTASSVALISASSGVVLTEASTDSEPIPGPSTVSIPNTAFGKHSGCVDANTQRHMNTVDAICAKYVNTNSDDLDPNDAFYERSKKLLPHLHHVRTKMVRQLTAQARTVEIAADDAQRLANDAQRLSDEVHALALESHGLTTHAQKLMCEKERLIELEKERFIGSKLDWTALERQVEQGVITSSAALQAARYIAAPELASESDKLTEEADQLRTQAESVMAKATQSADAAEAVSIEASRVARVAVDGAGEMKIAMSVLVTVDTFIKELEVMWGMMAMKVTVVEE